MHIKTVQCIKNWLLPSVL